MSNIVTLELHERKYELFFSCKAMNAIADRCGGDLKNISAIMSNMTEAKSVAFICGMLSDLANGAVVKHNCDIALGLATGDKKPEYTEEYFVATVGVEDFEKVTAAVFEAMGLGSEFTLPDDVKVEEEDIDLAEIEAEKQKSKKS